jgi:hypothetical protein
VNGFFRKIARFAVSKMAAFCYAVAVGVAGNLAFHFVQPQFSIPSILTGAPEAPRSGEKPSSGPAATATIVPKPAIAPIPEPPGPGPSAIVSTPAAPPAPKPMPALQLPEPPAASLPEPASLPSPGWKPLGLPSAPAPSEATAKPIGAPNGAASNPAPVAALPPLEVGTPPIAALASPPSAAEPPPPRSLELSDLWHPYRAVKKGLNWAGDQLPVIGGDDGEARPPAIPPRREVPAAIPAAASAHAAPVARLAAPAAPIPLWPDAKAEAADKPPPGKPGPGSGGLY